MPPGGRRYQWRRSRSAQGQESGVRVGRTPGECYPRSRLHDLRHTHATLALQAGIHPKVVSERLGHATIAITLDTYSHAIPAMQEEAATLIARLVLGEK